jgi:uncharacterized protein YwgA
MKSDTIFEEEFTLLEKTILALLYLKEKSPIFGKLRLQKMIFLISQDFEKLRDELDFEPHRYGMYDQTIDDMIEGLELDGFVTIDENNNKIALTQKGIEKAGEILKEFSEKEIETIEEVKELFEGLTEDEILALLYFKFPEFAKYSEKLNEINKKRRELAISLYKKGKVSLEAASEIAGMNVKDFMKLLKERNLL